jgi:acyl dehydratase
MLMISITLEELRSRNGESLGTSGWQLIDQDTIDSFARVTHDEQWIHVDPSRSANGPFGGPVAHGFLTLSLCSRFLAECLAVQDATVAVNYGRNRVRFPTPVVSGTRVARESGASGYR